MFIIEISYNFLYVWNCVKLYGQKFFIYNNCMIRSFGQPVSSCLKEILSSTSMVAIDPQVLGSNIYKTCKN